jgi:integrase
MFDPRAAKALAPGDHLTVDGAPGLRLVASVSRRTWTYRYRSPVDGRMRQIRLGHWPAMGLPAALAAWERVQASRLAGNDPALDKRQERRETATTARVDRYTVRQAIREYLEAYEGSVTRKTFAEVRRQLEVDAAPILDRPAASITRADAFGLIDGMRDRPVQGMKLRRLLGAVWDRALDAGRLAPEVPNWWRMILRGGLPSKGRPVRGQRIQAKRVLSESELRVLIPWLPNFSRDVADVLTLYLWTCCRGAEIVGMRRDELADEGGVLWWTIPKERLKARASEATHDLRVPMVGRAEDVVRRRLDAIPGRHLFPSPDPGRDHIRQNAIGLAVWMVRPTTRSHERWVRPRLALDDWTPHDLRRTGRTLLAALGCPSEIAEAILGHAQPGIVGVYNLHRYDAERLHWLRRLSSHLEMLSARAPAADR